MQFACTTNDLHKVFCRPRFVYTSQLMFFLHSIRMSHTSGVLCPGDLNNGDVNAQLRGTITTCCSLGC